MRKKVTAGPRPTKMSGPAGRRPPRGSPCHSTPTTSNNVGGGAASIQKVTVGSLSWDRGGRRMREAGNTKKSGGAGAGG